MNAQEMASKFLDLWEEAHETNPADYERLKQRYGFIYNETPVGGGMLFDELCNQRKERGLWEPEPGGKKAIPTIEGAIFMLLRAAT
jgi:hypothetical protein